jgi:hypothetical protein
MPTAVNPLLRRLLWAIEQGRRDNLKSALAELLTYLERDGEMPDTYLFHRLLGELLATVPDRLFRQEIGRQASELARLPDDMLREAKAADRKRKRAARVKPATD